MVDKPAKSTYSLNLAQCTSTTSTNQSLKRFSENHGSAKVKVYFSSAFYYSTNLKTKSKWSKQQSQSFVR